MRTRGLGFRGDVPGAVELECRLEAQRGERSQDRVFIRRRLPESPRELLADLSEDVVPHTVIVLNRSGNFLGRSRGPLGLEALDYEAPRDERPGGRSDVGRSSPFRAPRRPHERKDSLSGEADESLEKVAEADRRRRCDVHGLRKIDPGGGPGQHGHGNHTDDEGSGDGPARVLGAPGHRSQGARIRFQ